MILVDIKVPSVEKEYDFKLDENIEIANIVCEISEIISRKEHCMAVGNQEELMLCDMNNNIILQMDKTLAESNIHTGDRLMLI